MSQPEVVAGLIQKAAHEVESVTVWQRAEGGQRASSCEPSTNMTMSTTSNDRTSDRAAPGPDEEGRIETVERERVADGSRRAQQKAEAISEPNRFPDPEVGDATGDRMDVDVEALHTGGIVDIASPPPGPRSDSAHHSCRFGS